MRGLVLDQGALHYREDLRAPTPQRDETLVAVRCAGICATDLALARGYMGFRGIPGHEFVGEALNGPLAGQRVVGEINAACGGCADCRAGRDRHCPQRSVLGILDRAGAFAERLTLPTRNLLAVPDGVSDHAATFTEPLAAALAIGEAVDLPTLAAGSAEALVAGDGKLGLLCAHALALAGLRVTVYGRHPERRKFLPEDAELITGMLEEDGAAPLRRWDLAIEATGNPDVLPRLLPTLRPRGRLVLKTTTERPLQGLDLAPLVVDEIGILGSRCGRFAPALDALANQRVPVERLVSAVLPLQDGEEGFRRAGAGGCLKVLLEI